MEETAFKKNITSLCKLTYVLIISSMRSAWRHYIMTLYKVYILIIPFLNNNFENNIGEIWKSRN